MNLAQAIILSIIEGITEFLPVSSTGHLVLASELLAIPQTEFVKSFEIFIQLGAILAVVWLYRREMLDFRSWMLVLPAFVPTAILGFIFYDFIKANLIGNINVTLAALLIGGIVIILLDRISTNGKKFTTSRAVGTGLFQAISMIPGVSRSAASIIGARILGISKQEAVKFSFLLAVPTMFAATGLDLVKSSFSFSSHEWQLLIIGFIGSFITALIAVKLFIQYVAKNSLVAFGVYRIILAVVYYFFY